MILRLNFNFETDKLPYDVEQTVKGIFYASKDYSDGEVSITRSERDDVVDVFVCCDELSDLGHTRRSMKELFGYIMSKI